MHGSLRATWRVPVPTIPRRPKASTAIPSMPRSSRSNPADLHVDHEYEARMSQIKLGKGAGAMLAAAFSSYLTAGTDDRGINGCATRTYTYR